MKLLILTLFLSLNAFGIDTKNCPEEISIKLEGFSFDKSSNAEVTALKTLKSELKRKKIFVGSALLMSTANSICRYSGHDIEGALFDVRLKGSTRAGAADPATATIYFQDRAVTYLKITDVSLKRITMKSFGSKANLYYRDQVCSSGYCTPRYKSVGFIKNAKIK